MDVLVTIVVALLGLFVIGRLGALAVPGPDPMPAWLTIVIGFGAAVAGGGIGYAAGGAPGFIGGATVAAAALIVGYRRVFQRRGLSGPEAWKYPTRGLGVAKIRRRRGIAEPASSSERQLAYLDELHAAGILSADELREKQGLVRAQQPG